MFYSQFGVLEPDSSPPYHADKPTALSTYKPDLSSSSMQYKIKVGFFSSFNVKYKPDL